VASRVSVTVGGVAACEMTVVKRMQRMLPMRERFI
jgi:hypothetical protein